MYEIISKLKESGIFASIDVVEFVDEESVKLIKIKAKVLDESLLYITELHTSNYQKYSYHWQDKDGELTIRWDNKPHWKNLKTFPHHKHEHGSVLPFYRITIEDVIEIIRGRLK